MKDDLLISLRRTLVPIVVGIVTGSFLAPHIDPDALKAVVGGVVSGLYYAILRVVEVKAPGVGLLLGARKQPVYTEPLLDYGEGWDDI